MGTYNSKEFKKTQLDWYKKLKSSGFKDIEDKHENLYQPNLRTIAWQNRDLIREFFFSLDDYLNTTKNLPPKHRRILRLWSSGMHLIDISRKTKISIAVINRVVCKYKKIVLSYQKEAPGES